MKPDYYLKHLDEAKDLIEELAQNICQYAGQTFEIIDNPERKDYDKNAPMHLTFPYAVKWIMQYTEKYFGKNYSEILFIDEELEGLVWKYEDYEVPITGGEWLFIGFSGKLQDKLVLMENKINKLEEELKQLKEGL